MSGVDGRDQQKRKAEWMDYDTYMPKLAGIRAQLYEAHSEAVHDYPRSSPEETLDRIIATHEPIESSIASSTPRS
jgi:hypothetical protein